MKIGLDRSPRHDLQGSIRRWMLIAFAVVAVEVAAIAVGWNLYRNSTDRPKHWPAVVGHLTFWNLLILATISTSTIALMKGHRRYRWVHRYLFYAVVALVVLVVADNIDSLDNRSPTNDTPALLVFAVPFALMFWSVIAAPLILIVTTIFGFVRSVQPAREGSWWQRSALQEVGLRRPYPTGNHQDEPVGRCHGRQGDRS